MLKNGTPNVVCKKGLFLLFYQEMEEILCGQIRISLKEKTASKLNWNPDYTIAELHIQSSYLTNPSNKFAIKTRKEVQQKTDRKKGSNSLKSMRNIAPEFFWST